MKIYMLVSVALLAANLFAADAVINEQPFIVTSGSSDWPTGKLTEKYPHVVYGVQPFTYVPALGYQWEFADHRDVRVVWVPRMLYPDLHIVSGDVENTIVPEQGYQWKGKTGAEAREQIKIGDIAAGLAVFGALQKMSDRIGRDIDRLLPERGPNGRQAHDRPERVGPDHPGRPDHGYGSRDSTGPRGPAR